MKQLRGFLRRMSRTPTGRPTDLIVRDADRRPAAAGFWGAPVARVMWPTVEGRHVSPASALTWGRPQMVRPDIELPKELDGDHPFLVGDLCVLLPRQNRSEIGIVDIAGRLADRPPLPSPASWGGRPASYRPDLLPPMPPPYRSPCGGDRSTPISGRTGRRRPSPLWATSGHRPSFAWTHK